jgi:hypothetical protein
MRCDKLKAQGGVRPSSVPTSGALATRRAVAHGLLKILPRWISCTTEIPRSRSSLAHPSRYLRLSSYRTAQLSARHLHLHSVLHCCSIALGGGTTVPSRQLGRINISPAAAVHRCAFTLVSHLWAAKRSIGQHTQHVAQQPQHPAAQCCYRPAVKLLRCTCISANLKPSARAEHCIQQAPPFMLPSSYFYTLLQVHKLVFCVYFCHTSVTRVHRNRMLHRGIAMVLVPL